MTEHGQACAGIRLWGDCCNFPGVPQLLLQGVLMSTSIEVPATSQQPHTCRDLTQMEPFTLWPITSWRTPYPHEKYSRPRSSNLLRWATDSLGPQSPAQLLRCLSPSLPSPGLHSWHQSHSWLNTSPVSAHKRLCSLTGGLSLAPVQSLPRKALELHPPIEELGQDFYSTMNGMLPTLWAARLGCPALSSHHQTCTFVSAACLALPSRHQNHTLHGCLAHFHYTPPYTLMGCSVLAHYPPAPGLPAPLHRSGLSCRPPAQQGPPPRRAGGAALGPYWLWPVHLEQGTPQVWLPPRCAPARSGPSARPAESCLHARGRMGMWRSMGIRRSSMCARSQICARCGLTTRPTCCHCVTANMWWGRGLVCPQTLCAGQARGHKLAGIHVTKNNLRAAGLTCLPCAAAWTAGTRATQNARRSVL